MAITAILELSIKSESLAEAVRIIDETLAATRAFPGNLGVEVAVDVVDPSHYVLIERWESVEADEAYRAFRKTPDGASQLRTILVAPPRLVRYAAV